MNQVANTSRRRFVVGGLVAVAAAGVSGCGNAGSGSVASGSGGAAGGAAASAGPPLLQSEASEWEKFVGNTFTITGDSGATLATLAAVERGGADVGRPADLARHQAFYAYFEVNSKLPDAVGKTYSISHAVKGTFDLFLGPVDNTGAKSVLLAVMN